MLLCVLLHPLANDGNQTVTERTWKNNNNHNTGTFLVWKQTY